MLRRRRMWLTSGCWTSPVINRWSGLKPEQNLFHNHKEVLERTMCVITADFKGTPDPIVISWEHWEVQVIKGQEMTRGLGLLSCQEIEMVISEWWTWWRWLVHSPTVWKASLEGLKVFIRRFESPNSCTQSSKDITPNARDVWVMKVLMHKHYNMSIH